MAELKNEWEYNDLILEGSRKEIDEAIGKERKEIERRVADFSKKWRGNSEMLSNPAKLAEALEEYEKLCREKGTTGKTGYYIWLKSQKEQNNPDIKGRYQHMTDFSTKMDNELQFFRLSIAKIEKKHRMGIINDAMLEGYRHFLERIFDESDYLLSEAEEKILNLKSSSAYEKWVKMTSEFLAKEEKGVISEKGAKEKAGFAEIRALMDSQDKRARDSAALAFNEIVEKHSDVAEAEMNAIMADKKVNDELRKMERSDFARHLSDDIEPKSVDVMLKSVEERFKIAERYYALKAKLFGIKKLEYHERNVPYGKIDKKYSFEEGAELVRKVFMGLNGRFYEIFKKFLDEGRIDVYPKKGKKDGAFCVHWSKLLPTYILLNHTGRLQDVLTLAHELGHGINNEYIKEKQNALYFDTPLATAEVASTFMEDFVLEELEKEADDELRLALMVSKLNDDVSTIFRQVACYRFEQEMHKEFRAKGYLSKGEIGRIFQKNMAAYMGDAVKRSKGSENWWVYWSHIRSFFYVYSYASGLLISKAMQREIRKNKSFMPNVEKFLSSGTSDSPRNIFKGMGIDISEKKFWEEGLDEIEELLKRAEILAKKLKKI